VGLVSGAFIFSTSDQKLLSASVPHATPEAQHAAAPAPAPAPAPASISTSASDPKQQ